MKVQEYEKPNFPHSWSISIGAGEVNYSGWFMAWLEAGSRGTTDSGRRLVAVRVAKYAAAGFTHLTYHLNSGPHLPLMIMGETEAKASLSTVREADGGLVYETNQDHLNARWNAELATKYQM